MEEEFLNDYLTILICWAEDRGFYVNFEENGDNAICSKSKIIEINSSSPLREQVISLLHECGHVAIYKNGSTWSYDRPMNLYSVPPSHYEKTGEKDRYRVYTIIEEIEAWKRAFKLAKRICIPITKEEWEESMFSAIGKYLDWSVS